MGGRRTREKTGYEKSRGRCEVCPIREILGYLGGTSRGPETDTTGKGGPCGRVKGDEQV